MFTLALLIITTFLLPLYLAPAQIVQAARIPQAQAQLAPNLTLTYTGNVTVTTFHGLITYQATQTILHNTAQVRQPDGAVVNAEETYLIDCTITDDERLYLYLPLVDR